MPILNSRVQSCCPSTAFQAFYSLPFCCAFQQRLWSRCCVWRCVHSPYDAFPFFIICNTGCVVEGLPCVFDGLQHNTVYSFILCFLHHNPCIIQLFVPSDDADGRSSAPHPQHRQWPRRFRSDRRRPIHERRRLASRRDPTTSHGDDAPGGRSLRQSQLLRVRFQLRTHGGQLRDVHRRTPKRLPREHTPTGSTVRLVQGAVERFHQERALRKLYLSASERTHVGWRGGNAATPGGV